jgi:hypothetical protein
MTESQELEGEKRYNSITPKREGKGYKTKCKVSTKIEVRSNTHMAYNSFASTSTEKCSGSVYTV